MPLYCYRLNNGVLLPVIGFGTWELRGDDVTEPLKRAVALGYRHVDSAQVYHNYANIAPVLDHARNMKYDDAKFEAGKDPKGDAICVGHDEFTKNFTLPHGPVADGRTIFLTGKVGAHQMSPSGVRESIEEFLCATGRESADLILLHWPGKSGDNSTESLHSNRVACWKELESLYAKKKIRAIGVSNYMESHLGDLIKDVESRKEAGDMQATVPMVNQIEISPLLAVPSGLAKLCNEHGIRLESYCTLGGSRGNQTVLKNPMLKELAQLHNATPAQIALRWATQKGYVVLPRSSKLERVTENFDSRLLDLTPEEISKIDAQDCQARFSWNPNTVA